MTSFLITSSAGSLANPGDTFKSTLISLRLEGGL